MTRILTLLITCLLLVGCTSSSIAPAPTSTSAPTALPTNTPTPTPEPTPTPTPIDGMLFFDMNGSGLRDEASFQYDSARLADERQPLQADLLAAINAYLTEHPDIKDGDLVTLEEPGLSGYTVCAGSNCVTTDEEGRFQLVVPEVSRSLSITIQDPNVGTPALEMRYINNWKRAVTVAEYTKDTDISTMGQIKAIPDCETDAAAQVCKQDEDTLLVREQHLNDTTINQLADGAELLPDKPNELGLIQGAFSAPFFSDSFKDIYIWGYFDIFHKPEVCGNQEGLYPDGKQSSYDGKYSSNGGFDYINPKTGVHDGHLGYDFRAPVGTITINGGPKASVSFSDIRSDGEKYVILNYKLNDESLASYYGHLATILVRPHENILSGQIVGLTGHSGSSPYYQLHWDLARYTVKKDLECTKYLPVYYSDLNGIDLTIARENYWVLFNTITLVSNRE